MLIIMKREILSELKKIQTWLIMIVICVITMFLMMQFENKRSVRPFEGEIYIESGAGVIDAFLGDDVKREQEKKINSVLYNSNLKLIETQKLERIAVFNNDLFEAIKYKSRIHLLIFKIQTDTQSKLDQNKNNRHIMKIWETVFPDEDINEINFAPNNINRFAPNLSYLVSDYYATLYSKSIRPTYQDEANNVTTAYNYFFYIAPILMLVLSYLNNYSNVTSDKLNGTLKLLITQNTNRNNYYMGKYFGRLFITFLSFIIPVFTMCTFYGFRNGFINLNYPVTFYKLGFTTFKPAINNYEKLLELNIEPRLIGNGFFSVLPSSETHATFFEINEHIRLIGIYKYLLLCVILALLYIAFISALLHFISMIAKREITSAVISIAVLLFLYSISLSKTGGDKYNLNPLNFNYVSRIVEGSYNVNYIVALIILIVATVIIMFAGKKIFNWIDLP